MTYATRTGENFNTSKNKWGSIARTFLILGCSAFVEIAHSQDTIVSASINDLLKLSLEELTQVEIVTGTKQSILKAPAVATVITAEDISKSGATDLDEILESVPGLHVSRSSARYMPIYNLRGVYSDNNPEVLVLINGIPLNELYSGSRGVVWGGMPVNAIARIEVIRGPGSALYGADAFAGVINILTKSHKDTSGTETGVRLGSFASRDLWLLHGGNYQGFDTALSIEYHDSDGQREIITEDAQTTLDKLYGSKISLAPGPVNVSQRSVEVRLDLVKDDWQIRAGYQGRRNIGTGAGLAGALDSDGRYQGDRLNADLTYHNPQFTENWQVTAQASYLYTAFETAQDVSLYPRGAFGGAFPAGVIGNIGISEQHGRFNLSGFYSGFPQHILRIGIGHHYGNLYDVKDVRNALLTSATIIPTGQKIDLSNTAQAFLKSGTRRNSYLFVQDTWTFKPDWELTAGWRYDDYSDFGSTANPRLALVWQIHPNLATKLLYGRAFRAPAFIDLYSINNPLIIGNPNLQAETIDTYELAFTYHATRRIMLGLNIFNYYWHHIISFVPNNDGTRTAQNIGEQHGRGLETEMRWQFTDDLSLLGNYAFQHAIDTATEANAGFTPRHHIFLRADWQFLPDWHLSSQINWVADRHRALHDPRPAIADYATVDLTLHHEGPKKQWEFALSARNLFDEDAREPSQGTNTSGFITIPNDLPLAGRSYFIELRYKF